MTISESFYYNNQLRKYIVQFAAIFQGIQIRVGVRNSTDAHLAYVPVKNASSDKVVAAIKSENTQNKPLRLPMMSFQLVNVDLAPELRKGIGTSRRNTFLPTGSLFPDDIKTVEQRMPVPYTALFDLVIWASNQDQHYQIIEQILSLFDPILQIQTNDDILDWSKITKVELMAIRFDEAIPAGGDRRLIQTTLSFAMPIYLSVSAKEVNNYIKEIFMRIGVVSNDIQTSYDALADLDSQNIEYESVFSVDDIDIS